MNLMEELNSFKKYPNHLLRRENQNKVLERKFPERFKEAGEITIADNIPAELLSKTKTDRFQEIKLKP